MIFEIDTFEYEPSIHHINVRSKTIKKKVNGEYKLKFLQYFSLIFANLTLLFTLLTIIDIFVLLANAEQHLEVHLQIFIGLAISTIIIGIIAGILSTTYFSDGTQTHLKLLTTCFCQEEIEAETENYNKLLELQARDIKMSLIQKARERLKEICKKHPCDFSNEDLKYFIKCDIKNNKMLIGTTKKDKVPNVDYCNSKEALEKFIETWECVIKPELISF